MRLYDLATGNGWFESVVVIKNLRGSYHYDVKGKQNEILVTCKFCG